MLYLIGGASRAGKSLLARRLLAEHGVPGFPLDAIMMAAVRQPGQVLAAGEAALVIESMKLEHSLSARAATTVAEVLVEVGQQVTPGQVLLRFAKPQVQKEAA